MTGASSRREPSAVRSAGAPPALFRFLPPAALLLLGAAFGLWGLRWGLPGPARWRAFPPSYRASPAEAQKMADDWRALYRKIRAAHRAMGKEPATYARDVVEIPAGWTRIPAPLLDSYRSLLTQSTNPDEKKSFIILSQMRPWKLDFNILYIEYAGGYIYPLGAFLYLGAKLAGAPLTPDLAYYLLHPASMGRLYLLGRLFIVLTLLASLLLIYDLGRRLSGPSTGFLAALFFLLCPVVAVYSHILKPHFYVVLWTLGVLRWSELIRSRGERRDYLLAGAFLGMAAGSELDMAVFACVPLLAWGLRRRREKPLGRPPLRPLLECFAAAAAVWLAANPTLLLASRRFLHNLVFVFTWGGSGHRSTHYGAALAAVGRAFVPGMGPLLLPLAAAGLAAAWLGDEDGPRLLATAAAVCFAALFVGLCALWGFQSDSGALRFYCPIVAPLCLLAAWLLHRPRVPRAARGLAAAAVVATSGLGSLVYLRNMSLESGPRATKSLAADWIEANVAPGASIGLTRYPEPAHTPPFRYDLYRLVVFPKPSMLAPSREPEYVVVDSQADAFVAPWAAGRYRLVKSFRPWRAAWARVADDSFFANTGIFIYRREAPAPRKS
ncbi:MAG: glycosyltransferase family 39 protein [Elusimicrobia bacterium]|nr:glycosyltransferase family 39 protein [Elusimicrobiota bacterium]